MLKLLKLLLSAVMFTSFVVSDESGGTPPEEDENIEEVNDTKEPMKGEEIDENEMNQSILKEEARLSIMEQEYTDLSDSIHDEFEKELATNPSSILTEDEMETLEVGGDFVAKNKLLREKFENFRDSKLAEKKELIDTFSKEIKTKKGQHELISATNKFSRDNPKINMDDMAEFIQEDLSNRKKQEFLNEAGEDKYKFLELVAKEMGTGTEKEEEDLPTDLTELSGTSAEQFNSQEEASNYLARIGAGGR